MQRKIKYGLCILLNLIRVPFMRLVSFGKIKCSFMQLFTASCEIKASEKGSISIGKLCRFDKHTLLRCEGASLTVGKNVYINRGCNVVAREKIDIADNVTIGPNVCIYDHDHNYMKKSGADAEYITAPIVIGENVWIGANCSICKGVTIGENSVIAAGSVVTKDVEAHTVCGGVPAHVIKNISH